MTRFLPAFLPFVLGLACARDNAVLEPPAPCPSIIGISVNPPSASLAVGDSVQFTARVLLYRGSPCVAVELDGPFAWAVADSAVAMVRSSSGRVLARSAGSTVVTARWVENPNFAANIQLRVSR
jgi:hypothetical protein